MTPPAIAVAPIVEGHGEVSAVPILLRRIFQELFDFTAVEILRPIRQPRNKLLRNNDDCLQKSLNLAVQKLQQDCDPRAAHLILVILDADQECAAKVGPRLLKKAAKLRADAQIGVVLAVWEYETWFVSAAESLSKYLDLRGEAVPEDPEGAKCRKRWIEDRWRGTKYSEAVDQPKLTAEMNLHDCRSRSPSFDKLCREIERRLS